MEIFQSSAWSIRPEEFEVSVVCQIFVPFLFNQCFKKVWLIKHYFTALNKSGVGIPTDPEMHTSPTAKRAPSKPHYSVITHQYALHVEITNPG